MDRDQFGQEIERGEALLQIGKIDEALKVFQSVLEKQPDNVLALNDKGVALNNLGRYEEAIQTFLKILRKENSNSNAVFNLISNYLAVGKWDEVDNIFQEYSHCLAEQDVAMIRRDLEEIRSAGEKNRHPGTVRDMGLFNLDVERKKAAVCLICQSGELKRITTNMSFGIDIVECLECGFVQSGYVSESALGDYYSKFYRGPLSKEEIESLRQKSYDQAVSQIEYINSIIPGKKFTNSLDYGTADGELAKLLKGISQAVYVTEFDPQYVELLKKEKELILLDESGLDSGDFSDFFDFISISHVLEHLTDPISSLERFSRLLKKDGFLLVDIPNEVELLTTVNFQAKGHLSYFTVDSFRRLVDTHGKFDILEIRTCNRSVEEFIASGFRLPEQYFRQNTPNGTVIRALLLNARADALLDRRPKDFIDDRLLLDDYSRRILHMHKSFMAIQAQKDEIERRCETNREAHGKPLKRLNQFTSEQIDLSNKAVPGKLDQEQIDKLESFLERVKKDTYPEPILEPHATTTKKMFEYLLDKFPVASNSRILDVGCGQGMALELFTKKGFAPIGITLNGEDVSICQQKGYEVCEMDQSFLNFPDEEFDVVWCRHCLEHSIFPYFTLSELFRVLKQKGYLYIEVPAPDTSCEHQTNKNHYSVLGKSMWGELIKRTGFNILEVLDISFMVHAGPDVFWAFIQQKP